MEGDENITSHFDISSDDNEGSDSDEEFEDEVVIFEGTDMLHSDRIAHTHI